MSDRPLLPATSTPPSNSWWPELGYGAGAAGGASAFLYGVSKGPDNQPGYLTILTTLALTTVSALAFWQARKVKQLKKENHEQARQISALQQQKPVEPQVKPIDESAAIQAIIHLRTRLADLIEQFTPEESEDVNLSAMHPSATMAISIFEENPDEPQTLKDHLRCLSSDMEKLVSLFTTQSEGLGKMQEEIESLRQSIPVASSAAVVATGSSTESALAAPDDFSAQLRLLDEKLRVLASQRLPGSGFSSARSSRPGSRHTSPLRAQHQTPSPLAHSRGGRSSLGTQLRTPPTLADTEEHAAGDDS